MHERIACGRLVFAGLAEERDQAHEADQRFPRARADIAGAADQRQDLDEIALPCFARFAVTRSRERIGDCRSSERIAVVPSKTRIDSSSIFAPSASRMSAIRSTMASISPTRHWSPLRVALQVRFTAIAKRRERRRVGVAQCDQLIWLAE